MNNTGKTLKKGKELWITEPVAEDDWSWLQWLMSDADLLGALLTPQLPIIRW